MALVCLMRDRRVRLQVLVVGVIVFALGRYVVWPRLDAFTGGTISARFSEADVTRRDTLGWEDLHMWDENPLLGMGPGRSSLGHDDRIIAHTEFTRLLAEHGLFGAIAIVLFLLAGARNVLRADSPKSRALAIATMTWACLFMANSAMRTAAPSLMFGMTFIPFERARRAHAIPARPAAPARQVAWWPRRRVLVGAEPSVR
jgi:O-antigen ligase